MAARPTFSQVKLDRLDVERSILRFPSLLHVSEGLLRTLAKGNWKIKSFFVGWVGLDSCCSVQAAQRKIPVAVGPLPGAYLLTENNFVPICGVTRKEFETGHTHTHTHTHTRAHTPLNLKAVHGARKLGKNENRFAWTCWRSIVWPH